MNNMARCHSCANDIQEQDIVVTCQGFCKSTFHLKCCRMSEQFWANIKASAQTFWMCSGCSELMKKSRFRNAVSGLGEYIETLITHHETALTELKKEIRMNSEKIDQIASSNSCTPLKRKQRFNIDLRPAKLPRTIVDSPKINSHSQGLQCGNKEADQTFASSVTAPAPPPKFQLFLSRFHPLTTENDIEKLVQQNLKINYTVEVTKLVRKGTNLNELKFISFKVGMDPELKNKAMDPSAWQRGIYFREFIGTQPAADEQQSVFTFRTSAAIEQPTVAPVDGVSTPYASPTRE